MPMKQFNINECVVFHKTKEMFGGFSNMSSEYPLQVNNVVFPTSEHFYQVMKYGDHPDIQKEILGEKNPLLMKNKQKKHKDRIRGDWEQIKFRIMEITLHLKLVNHWVKFGSLLLKTERKSVVELSKKDPFWGMKSVEGRTDILLGENQLGELLVKLREMVRDENNVGLRKKLSIWTGEECLKLKLLGETLREVGVCEKVYLVGERSFAYIIKKHTLGNVSPIYQSALVQAA